MTTATDPTVIRSKTCAFPIATLKAIDPTEPAGTFEAIVSVFNNVDHHRDVIRPGAFVNSIASWAAAGDPLPIIFSHQWNAIDAYVGLAEADGIEELPPGHADLPDTIKELGGLRVRGRFLVDDPVLGAQAAKVHALVQKRIIREWSFAYDVLGQAEGNAGTTELTELALIEAGPTLKGANPLTITGDVKNLDTGDKSDGDLSAKAFVSIDGSIERLQEKLDRAARSWAGLQPGGVYRVDLEATFTDPPSIIFYFEDMDQPLGGGHYYRANYTVAGDTVALDEPEIIELVGVVRALNAVDRFRRKEGRRNSSADAATIKSIHDLATELGASCNAATSTSASPAGDEPPDGDVESSGHPTPIADLAAPALDVALGALNSTEPDAAASIDSDPVAWLVTIAEAEKPA